MPAQQNIWLWNSLLVKWEEAPAAVRHLRATGTGPVLAGRHKLHWVACTPSAPNAEWQLTDNTLPGAFIVYEHFDTDKESEQLNLIPPIQFVTGIYVEKFDNMTSLIFGYT